MKNVVRVGIAALIIGVLIVGYYFYLTHKFSGNREQAIQEKKEIEKVLSADFVKNYPQTPREVIKWYNRILMLYYDEDTTANQVKELCRQAQLLFDDELLKNNPYETYLESVQAEINDYRAKNKRMISAEVCDSSDVTYKKLNGDDMAYVIGKYFISENSDYQRTYQKYALRKDFEGHYKIVAFQLCDEDGRVD